LIISKETAIFLIENYTNLNGKIFQTYEQRKKTEKAVGDLAWCSSMKDPYDVG
jgi:predicted restriction endonuclease